MILSRQRHPTNAYIVSVPHLIIMHELFIIKHSGADVPLWCLVGTLASLHNFSNVAGAAARVLGHTASLRGVTRDLVGLEGHVRGTRH